MGTLLKKVERILKKEFPQPDKVLLDDDKGILGRVVSARFKGMEPMERITVIWDLLESNLTEEELQNIVHISAMTPIEEKAHSAASLPYLEH